jgi:dipeptidyl aminopeptidase/acylaminoacyl peptidase
MGSIREALLELKRPSAVSVAPDGRLAVVAEHSAHPAKGSRRNELWILNGAGEWRRISRDGEAVGAPAWSHDGRLAYASDETGSVRNAVMTWSEGAESTRAGTLGGPIEDLRWTGGSELIVLAADPGSDAAAINAAVKMETDEEDPKVLRPGTGWRRLWRMDLTTGEATELTPGGVSIWELDLLPDGSVVGIFSTDPTEHGWYRSFVGLLDSSGDLRRLYEPRWQIASPAASPDGRRVAVVEGWSSDRGLVAGDVRVVRVADGQCEDLRTDQVDASWVAWRDDASVWVAGWRGLGSAFGWLPTGGGEAQVWQDASTLGGSYAAGIVPDPERGRLLAVREALDAPPEVAAFDLANPEAGWRALSDFNDDVQRAVAGTATVEALEWTGHGGARMEGLLVTPSRDHRQGALVTHVHGGPTWGFRWAFNPGDSLELAEAGYAVFMPNPRGSTGWGQRFTQANILDPGGAELQDVLAGVERLVEDGRAERGRIGLMGTSYGGYLSAWAPTQTDAFATAIMISGISNNISCHNTANNAHFYQVMLGGLPHEPEAMDRYLDRSPIRWVGQVKSPVLILHGEKDLCTPLGQAQEFYQALVEAGKTTEMVIYPREGHGSHNWELEHQLDYTRRIIDWFDAHLGTPAQ